DGGGVEAPLTIMQSSGGVMTSGDATNRPVLALESGPAAGVVAAVGMARRLGFPNAIAFDMGGTTAKASLIEAGAVSRSREYEVGGSLSSGSRLMRGAGELMRIPTIDIAEVGAGGGSIAWLDPAGGLQVGPRSAGAEPGPARYGRGGSGPVHALGLADDLGCRTVLVPALAGLFSSLGLLFARPEFHDVHSCHLDARALDAAEISRVFDELEARLAPSLDGGRVEWIRSADLRYGGQSWEVEVELTGSLDDLLARFEDAHERLYGVRGEPGAPIEIRALRLAGLGPSAAVDALGLDDPRPSGGTRAATFEGETSDVPLRSRSS